MLLSLSCRSGQTRPLSDYKTALRVVIRFTESDQPVSGEPYFAAGPNQADVSQIIAECAGDGDAGHDLHFAERVHQALFRIESEWELVCLPQPVAFQMPPPSSRCRYSIAFGRLQR